MDVRTAIARATAELAPAAARTSRPGWPRRRGALRLRAARRHYCARQRKRRMAAAVGAGIVAAASVAALAALA